MWTLETLIKDEIGTYSLVNINTQGLGFNWVKRGQLWRWGFNGFTPGSHANTYCVVFSYKGELWKEIKVLYCVLIIKYSRNNHCEKLLLYQQANLIQPNFMCKMWLWCHLLDIQSQFSNVACCPDVWRSCFLFLKKSVINRWQRQHRCELFVFDDPIWLDVCLSEEVVH